MIVTVFLNLLALLVSSLANLLPSGSLPSEISTSVDYFLGVANQFSYVFPISTLLEAFALVVSVDIAILLWHFINWIIRKVPGMQ